MAGKTKYTRKGTRRNYKKQIVAKPKISWAGIPLSRTVKLRYSQQVSMSNPVGGAVHNFRANSLYDPDLTGVGGQPLGFDQMAALYNHYVVLGSKFIAKPIEHGTNTTSGDAPAFYIAKTSDNGDKDYQSVSHLIEATGKQPLVNQNYVYNRINKPRFRRDQATATYSARKMFRTNPMTNEDIKSLVTTNPVEEAVFQLYVFPQLDSAVNNSDSVMFQITIEFTAVFTEPKDIARS